jgi:hypothetical protein
LIARRVITVSVTILAVSVAAATVIGFWLSYAGLHGFAERNGLAGAEAWAWPASVDLFVIAGELGITISAVRRKRDPAAWVYLVLGFGASVAFNVLHVATWTIGWGRYAVAAVPPVAAMLALAALMRQVYRLAIDAGEEDNHTERVLGALAHAMTQNPPMPAGRPPPLNGTGELDPDATVTIPAIHDVGDVPMRRQ